MGVALKSRVTKLNTLKLKKLKKEIKKETDLPEFGF